MNSTGSTESVEVPPNIITSFPQNLNEPNCKELFYLSTNKSNLLKNKIKNLSQMSFINEPSTTMILQSNYLSSYIQPNHQNVSIIPDYISSDLIGVKNKFNQNTDQPPNYSKLIDVIDNSAPILPDSTNMYFDRYKKPSLGSSPMHCPQNSQIFQPSMINQHQLKTFVFNSSNSMISRSIIAMETGTPTQNLNTGEHVPFDLIQQHQQH